jgi:dihydroxy-acid dehydratase
VSEAALNGRIKPGNVVVLRGLGPVAAGMPEVHVATSALAIPELKGRVALISDTRVSGVSSGAIGVHCAPEALVGGPIGKLRDGDRIHFDLIRGTIETDANLDSRTSVELNRAKQPGYLSDFAALATQANYGCVSRTCLP